MRHLKYINQLEGLSQTSLFKPKDALELGVPRHALTYLVHKGLLERIYQGGYRFSEYEPDIELQWENLALIAASIPNGVICLISALCYYDLTDQIMREIWIAVPHSCHSPKRPNTRVVRMRNLRLGKTTISLGGSSLKIFDRERCIIDAFRYLSKEIAIKAIQKYFRGGDFKPNPKKLAAYAKALRVNIMPYILAYTI